MVNLVQSLKVGGTSYTIKDGNTIPGLTAGQKSVLLASGTYLDKAVVDGKVFETDAGKFERFNKTVTGVALGSTWTKHDMGVTYESTFNGIAYGAGVFVAYDQVGNVYYSTDGITWKPSQIPVQKEYTVIAFTGGRFVACSYDGQTSITSTDGINWTAGSAGSRSGSSKSITFANGYYYIFTPTTVRKSADGVNWVSGPSLSFNNSYGVKSAYGNGVLVVLSATSTSGGYQGAYMKDGESSWTTFVHQAGKLCGLAYGDGKFVAMNIRSYAYHSTDGFTWTSASLPAYEYWNDVVYGEGIFLALRTHSGTPQAYSVDGGVSWQTVTLPSGPWFWGAYGDGKFVAIAVNAAKVAINNLDITYSYSTTPLSYTADEVDALVSQATITEDKVDVSTGTLVL